MNIIRAEHLGMCFGVRDAIELARQKARQEPLTILGDLVHNETVLASLRQEGIRMESSAVRVQTRQAMITAHGASTKTIAAARAQGLEVFEGTCPLVHHAHKAVKELVANGYFPVIIGKKDHVEIRGITEDLDEYAVVLSDEDVLALPPKPRLGVASQTTQPVHRVKRLVELIRQNFPESEVRFMDTVCQPTKQRQRAAEELAHECDVVIVIGGKNSNNTHELVTTCSQFCRNVHHVSFPEDIKTDWFLGASQIGITAGTSTPDQLIDAVEQEIRRRI
jgi:4-hydroxy-3-methylbut-2-enyl diphosphate reductase